MPRLGRLSLSLPNPARVARGLMFVAVILLHDPASAQEASKPGDSPPVDQAAEEKEARERFQEIPWEEGPGTADLGDFAELRVSRGFVFTGPEGAKAFNELIENPPDKGLLGVLAPSESFDWFIL